jgi:hypothetical protein
MASDQEDFDDFSMEVDHYDDQSSDSEVFVVVEEEEEITDEEYQPESETPDNHEHIDMEIETTPEPENPDADRTCFFCYEVGHAKRNCPDKEPDRRNQQEIRDRILRNRTAWMERNDPIRRNRNKLRAANFRRKRMQKRQSTQHQ